MVCGELASSPFSSPSWVNLSIWSKYWLSYTNSSFSNLISMTCSTYSRTVRAVELRVSELRTATTDVDRRRTPPERVSTAIQCSVVQRFLMMLDDGVELALPFGPRPFTMR